MSELNVYYETGANRSAQYRGQGTTQNLVSKVAVSPAVLETAGGGNQVIPTSTDFGANSQFSEKRAQVYVENDSTFASSVPANGFVGLSLQGNGEGFPTSTELFSQSSGSAAGLITFNLANTPVTSVSSVFSGSTIYPQSGTVANASGAGWAQSGNSIVWNNGGYASYVTPMASGWVAPSNDGFDVTYTYGPVTETTITTSTIISALTPPGIQQAFLGNAGQTLGASSSFGGPDITR